MDININEDFEFKGTKKESKVLYKGQHIGSIHQIRAYTILVRDLEKKELGIFSGKREAMKILLIAAGILKYELTRDRPRFYRRDRNPDSLERLSLCLRGDERPAGVEIFPKLKYIIKVAEIEVVINPEPGPLMAEAEVYFNLSGPIGTGGRKIIKSTTMKINLNDGIFISAAPRNLHDSKKIVEFENQKAVAKQIKSAVTEAFAWSQE